MEDLVEGFFYGLYMDPGLLTSLGFEPIESRVAKLDGYELDLHGLAKIIPKSDSTVWGMLTKLRRSDLDAMYAFETTKAYKATAVEVTTADDAAVSVVCYNVPADDGAEFNREYLEKLVEVAKKMKLPGHYLQRLVSMDKQT